MIRNLNQNPFKLIGMGVKKCDLPRQKDIAILQKVTSRCIFLYNFKILYVREVQIGIHERLGVKQSWWTKNLHYGATSIQKKHHPSH